MASMQYDVKSAFTDADAALVTYRVRLKGIFVSIATGGTDPIIFYDNASAATGAILCKIPTAVAGQHTVVIPGEGILAENGIYCDTGDAAAVTIFYG